MADPAYSQVPVEVPWPGCAGCGPGVRGPDVPVAMWAQVPVAVRDNSSSGYLA